MKNRKTVSISTGGFKDLTGLQAAKFLQKNDIGNFILYTLLAFFLFRLFDIFKPYPIYKIDKNIKNGFGVMFDDVLAGVYSSVVILIFFSFYHYE